MSLIEIRAIVFRFKYHRMNFMHSFNRESAGTVVDGDTFHSPSDLIVFRDDEDSQIPMNSERAMALHLQSDHI